MRIDVNVKLGEQILTSLKQKVESSASVVAKPTAMLYEIVVYTFKTSQLYVPVETGYLKQSASMEGSQGSSSFMIRYPAPYAVYVHEIMSNIHPVGQPKYLQDAFVMSIKMAIRKYGAENIPDFHVGMALGVEEGVTMFLSIPIGKVDPSRSWRRLVGL